ncbi:Tubulin-tyrosine ligase family protein [Tritrichomonas foetus]|uniref:Tubulin-tyrosine ligase family protein n=1 Tax=Tritrichomonas foetus TaxID=1144522 RepID=A0A1J4K510_9EUKA|nr:Tubulin-tyrosine ligase family protein [Tritrichomonas foetus]|eukprot:OHT04804.1 Tubulin-tyrosine ligase family protein [Tritrichomonas foetus]
MLPNHTKIDVQKVRYPVVKQAFLSTNYIQTKDDVTALIVWHDGFIPKSTFLNILPHQRVSKIPGMDFLCFKSTTFKALNHMRALFPKTYNFFPITFLLPFQFAEFQKEHLKIAASTGIPVTWIFKPKSGCCGNGIKLIQNSFEVADSSFSGVIQKYVPPYLIDGFKFDFRIYIFIATIEPFTCYIYNDGVARFCSQAYNAPTKDNLNDKFSHLTNTAINVGNSETSHEILQLVSKVISKIKEMDPRGNVLWRRIKEVAALVMLAQYNNIIEQIKQQETENRTKQRIPCSSPGPNVPFNKKFFHLIGIDIMLNENCEPIILEMNDRPSMCVTFDIENTLKTKIVEDILKIITLDGSPPSPNAQFGGWEQILPVVEPNSPFSKTVQNVLAKSIKNTNPTMPKRVYPRDVIIWKKRASSKSYRGSSILPPLHANQ